MRQNKYLLSLAVMTSFGWAQEVTLDSVSVTATKIKTGTKEVSQSINVVDSQTIEDENILNISDALVSVPGVQAESSSNSPSPRLIIRGAGLKARYGVREIMVIKDGVPMTDPDSFTRFDYIDMQDVQSIEVQKGPGSINAVNATGGVIQLLTKSVFDEDKNRIKIGFVDGGQENINLKLRQVLSDKDFVSMSFTHRTNDNKWRDNNKFEATQVSIKYGHIFDDDATLESEFAYTNSNSELPASMNEDEFNEFVSTGKQYDTEYVWQNMQRNSEIYSFNVKYEKEFNKNWIFKPRVYFNHWKHFHPVTGIINVSDDNNVFGTDLEANYSHTLFDKEGTLVFGVTAKQDSTNDAKKYKYADIIYYPSSSWPFSPYIGKTLSSRLGELANTEDSKTSLYGLYFMETLALSKDLKIDISSRLDRLSFDIDGNEISTYDYTKKDYIAGKGLYSVDKSFTLFSSKLGLTYALNDASNVYTSVAFANQAPTTSEIGDNEALDKTKSINYEVGLKTRTSTYAYDIAIFQNDVNDEIIKTEVNGESIYDNAGKTRKRGLEISGIYKLSTNFTLGVSYTYSHFKYVSFEESVRGVFVNRDGNYLPYIPQHQYSLSLSYQNPNGFKSRVQTKSYGSYYIDNANSQKYSGYDFITDVMIGYEKSNHAIQLNVYNIFDKHYAMEVTKDASSSDASYKAAAPRSVMLTYAYKF